MLERRRGELGYGYRQRPSFVRDCGRGRISEKTISRLEKGERDSYPESTIGVVEVMYQWSPGSVESVLRGGVPHPLTGEEPHALITADPPPDRNPITVAHSPSTMGERLTDWVFIRMRDRGYDTDVIHRFIESEGLPREPTSPSSVIRIADVTGVSVHEIKALLGFGDISARPSQQQATTRL
jgi:hypothetical protein